MSAVITLSLCGDVMLGRGVDQILPHPGDPALREAYVSSARTYVALAESVNGPIPQPADYAYVWGDALAEWRRLAPDARIVNLETGITTSRDYAPKGIHYKMNPRNIACLTAAGIDCCALANNHVLDFGARGLIETLDSLAAAGIRSAGAGRDPAWPWRAGPGLRIRDHQQRRAPGVGRRRRPARRQSAARSVRAHAERNCDPRPPGAAPGRYPGRLDPLGRQLGLRDCRQGGPLRPRPDRCGRLRRRARPFLAPSQGHRDLPRAADPLRLRRFPERLRGHFRVSGVSRRACAALCAAAGGGDGPAR